MKSRWTPDPGAIPGEPFDYLDIAIGKEGEIGEARAVIIEIKTPGSSIWEARAFGGRSLGLFEIAEQARSAAEIYVDSTFGNHCLRWGSIVRLLLISPQVAQASSPALMRSIKGS